MRSTRASRQSPARGATHTPAPSAPGRRSKAVRGPRAAAAYSSLASAPSCVSTLRGLGFQLRPPETPELIARRQRQAGSSTSIPRSSSYLLTEASESKTALQGFDTSRLDVHRPGTIDNQLVN